MNIILCPVKRQLALVYLDDIVIFSQTLRQDINHNRHVLSHVKEAVVTLKLKKCASFTIKIGYLGHIICSVRLEVASHTTDDIHHITPPMTQIEFLSFISFCSIFCRLVPNFACNTSKIDSETTQNAGKRSWKFLRRGADRFAKLYRRSLTPLHYCLYPERRTIHPRHRYV